MEIEHLKTEISSIERYLRRRVHNRNCRAINICPALHPKCSEMLNLRTSLFWEMAKLLESISYYISNIDHKNNVNSLYMFYYALLSVSRVHLNHSSEIDKLKIHTAVDMILEETKTIIDNKILARKDKRICLIQLIKDEN